MKTPEERFWSKVDKKGPIHPILKSRCWEWTAGLGTFNYGSFWLNGRSTQAHRYSWDLYNETKSKNWLICHHCDNPKCVNPVHLFKGTHKDNTQDMLMKGRANKASGDLHGSRTKPESRPYGDRNGSRTRPERRPRGERHGLVKHPEKAARGDKSGPRLHPERLARGDNHGLRKHPEAVLRGQARSAIAAKGEKVNTSKLTEAQVIKARQLASEGYSTREIHNLINCPVNMDNLRSVIKRLTWKHLE